MPVRAAEVVRLVLVVFAAAGLLYAPAAHAKLAPGELAGTPTIWNTPTQRNVVKWTMPLARKTFPGPCAGQERIIRHADAFLATKTGSDGIVPVGYGDESVCTMWLAKYLTPEQLCVTIVHEEGHLAGLGHSDDPDNVMYYAAGWFAPCNDHYGRFENVSP